jgi:mobilome CxxCx(11)CxxC protein
MERRIPLRQTARRYKWLLRILDFLGIVVPVTVGGIVLSFGAEPRYLPYIVVPAGILSIIQLVMSVWSLVARWQDALVYAEESVSSNHRLSREYESLGRNLPDKLADLKLRYSLLEKENQLRNEIDNKQGLTEKEKRAGLRAGLRRFQRPCVVCGQVPQSMKPSGCDVCGNF